MYTGIEPVTLRVQVPESTSSGFNWLARYGCALRRRLRAAAEFAYLLLTGPF